MAGWRLLLAILVLLAPTRAEILPPTAPHILFILVDDYGWNDIGFHQNATSSANPDGLPTTSTLLRTPHLDALAAEGVRLEAYYVQPVCSPTRGAIQTGRYPSHTGIGPGVIPPAAPYGMPKEEVFLSEVLRGAGYATAAIGKWHLG